MLKRFFEFYFEGKKPAQNALSVISEVKPVIKQSSTPFAGSEEWWKQNIERLEAQRHKTKYITDDVLQIGRIALSLPTMTKEILLEEFDTANAASKEFKDIGEWFIFLCKTSPEWITALQEVILVPSEMLKVAQIALRDTSLKSEDVSIKYLTENAQKEIPFRNIKGWFSSKCKDPIWVTALNEVTPVTDEMLRTARAAYNKPKLPSLSLQIQYISDNFTQDKPFKTINDWFKNLCDTDVTWHDAKEFKAPFMLDSTKIQKINPPSESVNKSGY